VLTLASIGCVFGAFIGGAVIFVGGAVTFVGGAVTFVEGAVTFIGGAVTFVGGAITFVGGAVTFVGKESSAIGGLFKAVKARVADDIRGVDGRDLRQWLMIYKLKGPSLLINSLISASNYSIGLSL
jgi:hypothetical protein